MKEILTSDVMIAFEKIALRFPSIKAIVTPFEAIMKDPNLALAHLRNPSRVGQVLEGLPKTAPVSARPASHIINKTPSVASAPQTALDSLISKSEATPAFMRKGENRITAETIQKAEPVAPTTKAVMKEPATPGMQLIKKQVAPKLNMFGKGIIGATGLAGASMLGGAAVAASSGAGRSQYD